MPDRISDERIDALASALRGAQSDVYAVVAAIKSQRARADAAERLAESYRKTINAFVDERNFARDEWRADQADRDEARLWAEWLAAERDFYRAEFEQVRQIRHGDPEMFTATLMYELAEEEARAETERLRALVGVLRVSRRKYQDERDALNARIDAVRKLSAYASLDEALAILDGEAVAS